MCKITRVPFQIFVIYFYKRQKRGINLHSMGYSFLFRFSFVLCNPIHITLFVSLILFPENATKDAELSAAIDGPCDKKGSRVQRRDIPS